VVYTELHLHTSYSLLDGASQPEELVLQARALGYTALAITDHDGLYGAMEFAHAARAAHIQPIIGAEVTLADGSHLTLLAESRVGYGNLCRLITDSKHGIPPDQVALGDYAEGLILLTGCRQGRLAQLVDAGQRDAAADLLDTYITGFGGDNVFVELQQHRIHGDTLRIRQLVALAAHAGLPIVATGNVHYHHPDRHRLQDVLVAIRHRKTLDTSHRERRANAEFYLHSPAQMGHLFRAYPEAIRTTERIARRCAAFDLTTDLGYAFPTVTPPTQESPDAYLGRLCHEAFAERYPDASPHIARARDQLDDELRLIAKHRLAGFFLTYRDLLIMAREVAAEVRGYEGAGSRSFLPPGRGRGSAVSSIVCYLIGLSPVDPLRHQLYVGRFLNEDLRTVPDIDIDFPREIRERLIERVSDAYGHDHAALVGAFATYRLPSAVRDVGKVLGLPQTDIDRIARLSEPRTATDLGRELARMPEYAARLQTPPWSHLIAIAHQLAGFPRHITQHAGGMIISSEPLTELVPVQPAAMAGRFICQWDKDSVNAAGFIKIDFLALGMLSQVEECLALIDDHRQETIDLSRIDYDDPAVYRMIQQGDTIGTFQIESRAQIQMVRRTLPRSLDDLVVQVAIVRPGPIIGGAVTPFVQRRRDPGFRPIYDHPSLEPVLRETLGVVLYQEQVIQVAEVIAGFSAGQADQLRRSMTKKRSVEAMAAMRQQFLDGAAARGITAALAAAIYTKLEGFAGYGFPKSHAAAFALLAYQTCWLKHSYPAEFLCALLNNQPMGFYAPHVLINDAKHHGIRVLRPDINDSMLMCSIEGRRTVRIGLALIREVSDQRAHTILTERLRHGPYRSLPELFRRVPMRPAGLENLIGAGACDGFGLQRREMLWQIGLFIPTRGFGAGRTRTRTAGRQLSLPLPTQQDHVALPPTTAWQRVEEAYRVLGFSLLQHPVGLLRHQLPAGMTSSRELATLPHGMPVHLPGLVVCRQRPETAKGITFLLLEDEWGLVNVIVFPDLYARQRSEVRSVPFLIVEGTLQRTQNNLTIIATRLVAIRETEAVQPYRPTESGTDPWRVADEVDPQIIQLERPATSDGPRITADIITIAPDAHSYR